MQEENYNLSISEDTNHSENVPAQVTSEALPSIIDSYRELTLQMAFYFDSLKSVDAFFAKAAQRFHAENEKFTVKKNLNNEEVAQMMKNLAYGAATKGVGAIYKAYKTSEALSRIKGLLKAEGEIRLPALLELQEKLQQSITKATQKLNKALSYRRNEVEGIEKPFEHLRSLLYLNHQAMYLIATYEDAAKGKLQDRVEFPSMYHVNSYLLYNVVMPIGAAESAKQEQEKRRVAIGKLIASIDETLSGRLLNDPRDVLFALDSGLMAVAISDLVPPESRQTDEEGFVPINEEAMLTESIHEYMKLIHIGSLAEERPESTLGKALLSNKTFLDFVGKMQDMKQLSSLYENKTKIYFTNCVLIGVLAYLASTDRLDLRWYWSLMIGIGALVIALIATPFSKLQYIVKKKLTYIDNKILLSSLNSAGYIEPVSLKEIEKAANRIFWCALCGAILGFCCIPFPGGLIIGALVGAFFGNSKDEGSNPNFDYELIKIGSWKSITLMIILILGVLAYLYVLYF